MEISQLRLLARYRLYRQKLKSTANYLKTNKPAFYWSIIGVTSLVASGITFLVGLFLTVWIGWIGDVPSTDELTRIDNQQASVVLTMDDQILGKYYRQNRLNADFEEIPRHVIDALVATEDSRFYKHDGIDYRSWARVAIKSILLGDDSSGGGSTISQQLAKNLYPRKRYRFCEMIINKYREFIIAKRLENVHSKEEILNLYLNTVSFGEDAFGIKVASRRFFDKSPMQLNIEEGATLVGLLKANTRYSPKRNPKSSTKRRNVVLSQMVNYGYLLETQLDSLRQAPLDLKYIAEGHDQGIGTHFRELVRAEAKSLLESVSKEDGSSYDIYSDGLQIHTTIDFGMQQHAEDALAWHMKRLQKQFDDHWNGSIPWYKNGVEKAAIQSTDLYKRLKGEGKTYKQILEVFNEKREIEYFDWDGRKEVLASLRDSIQYYNALLNAGFVVMNHQGQIKAWIGGISYKDFQFDMVRSPRQVGSTFKPVIYANALANGYDPCSLVPNQLTIYTEYDDWQPENANNQYGGFYSVLGGIVGSVNTVAVDLIMNSGIEESINMAHNLGVTSDIPEVPSIALGTANLSLLEMTGMYQSLANDGQHIPPSFIDKITDQNGNVIIEVDREPAYEPAFSDTLSGVITKMLERVVNDGTGRRLRSQFGLTVDIAGKTGTTQSHADGWFIGYTPTLVAGARVGAQSPEIHFNALSLGAGSNMALPIWGKFMASLEKDPQYKAYFSEQFESTNDAIDSLLSCPLYLSDEEYLAMQEKTRLTEMINDILDGLGKRSDGTPQSPNNTEEPLEALINKIFKPKKTKTPSAESERIRRKNERIKKRRERQKKRQEKWGKKSGK